MAHYHLSCVYACMQGLLGNQQSELRGLEFISRAVSQHHNILAFFKKVDKT